MSKQPIPIIFHPKEIPFDVCAVDLIDALLQLRSDDAQTIVRLDDGGQYLSASLTSGKNAIDRAIVFTHGHPQSGQFVTKKPEINHHWWEMDQPIGSVLAYACHSAVILASPAWEKLFSDWVGATQELAFSSDQESQLLWKAYLEAVIDMFKGAASGEEFLAGMPAITMQFVIKCMGNPGLTLFKSLIIENAGRLTCKKLYQA